LFQEDLIGLGIMENRKTMSDFWDEANSILNKMENQLEQARSYQELHKEQLAMYKSTIDSSVSFNKERIDAIEKRWGHIRSTVVAISLACLAYFMTAGTMISQRPTVKEVNEIIDKKDFSTTDEVIDGFGVVIDDTYGILLEKEVITNQEQKILIKETQRGVFKELDPTSVSRSVGK